MIHVVEVSNPLHAAAYQVLYGRANPVNCATREQQTTIRAQFEVVRSWAETQKRDVAEAYDWAIKKIDDEIEKRLKYDELQRQVYEATLTIPTPPAEIVQ